MAAYIGPSFTGEAAQDRDWGDRPSHPGGASSRIPRARNITPSGVTAPSAKAIFRDGRFFRLARAFLGRLVLRVTPTWCFRRSGQFISYSIGFSPASIAAR